MKISNKARFAVADSMTGGAIARGSRHPRSGSEMTGAEMIIQVLSDEGVDTVFGYSGGAILPTYDAVFRWNRNHPEREIKLVVPANEQGAGFMAAGYSRASGRVGVSLVTSGPAATNSVTPVRDCMADSIPVVMISGQVSPGNTMRVKALNDHCARLAAADSAQSHA